MNPYKRVRFVFVALAEASVLVLISVIVLTTILISNANIDRRADETIAFIHDNPDNFPGFFPGFNPEEQAVSGQETEQSMPAAPEGNPPNQPGEGIIPPWENGDWGGMPGSQDTLAGLRYFTVKIMSDGNAEANTSKIIAFTAEEAILTAEDAEKKGSVSGYYGNYRYGVFLDGNVKTYIFLDWTNQLEPGITYRNNALIVGSAGAVLSFAVLLFVSRFITKPLELANEKQKKFVSDASHELKTPLAIISANNEIMEMINGESEETVAISKQVSKMTDMVRSMTTLAKLGEIAKSDFVDLDLSTIFLDVTHDFVPTFEKAGKKLNISATEGLHIKGIENEIRKLISINIENARKYAKSYCSASLFKAGKATVLRFKNDVATDIEPGPKPEVFNRFYRTDSARGSDVEGSGIGLSIAKEIASLHKADIICYVTNEKDFVIQIDF